MTALKIKEANFNKVCDWILQYPGQFDLEKVKDIKDSDVEFLAYVSLKGKGITLPFDVTFRRDLPDSFMITANTFLSEDLKKSVDALRWKEQQQIYIDLRIWIYPLNIQFTPDYPNMRFFKLIFYENLTKQFFFDSVNNLAQAVQLSNMRYDMEHNKMFPDGKDKFKE